MSIRKFPRGYTGYDSRNRFCSDPRLINPNAVYEKPVRTHIGKIPTVIVDPHNEVLPFWYKKDTKRNLLHIDKHSDTCADIPTFESLYHEGTNPGIGEYVRKHLNIASFIAPAVYYKMINKIFWLDPREDTLLEIKNNVGEEDGKIRFGYYEYMPLAYSVPEIKAIRELNEGFILDIDLDAFESLDDSDYWINRRLSLGSVRLERFLGKRRREKRFSRVKSLLSQLTEPELITIATSQTPITFVPPENVALLELRTLDLLSELYKR